MDTSWITQQVKKLNCQVDKLEDCCDNKTGGAVYTAGTGIAISGANVISATGSVTGALLTASNGVGVVGGTDVRFGAAPLSGSTTLDQAGFGLTFQGAVGIGRVPDGGRDLTVNGQTRFYGDVSVGGTINGVYLQSYSSDPGWGTRSIQIDEKTMEIRMYAGNSDQPGGIKWGGSSTQGGNHFGELRLFAGVTTGAPDKQNFITFFTGDNASPYTGIQRMVVNGLGQVGIGTPGLNYGSGGPTVAAASIDPSAILQIDSTTQGVLLPRMNTTSGITTPAVGLMIYNTTTNTINVYTASGWKAATLT